MALPAQDEQQRALELAYRALSSRERTTVELRAWLERKRVEPQAIEHAVAELRRAGFLDDARFARRFAEDKRDLERWGSERIERDLLRRGVAADVVAEVVESSGREAELSAALQLLCERVPPPADDRQRDRAWRLLVRKGYDAELAYDAVRAHGAGHAT
jgi:regulatory protein